MKLIVTTSDAYHHILPIFIHLFKKYWNKDQQVEIVGYKKPEIVLPNNFSFYSLGIQSGNKKDFSNDLRKYFEQQDQFFVWSMEDTFLKAPVDVKLIADLEAMALDNRNIGRIELTGENQQHHTDIFGTVYGKYIKETPPKCDYRLSTQIAIWNKDYLLRYLTLNLSPWDFECQPKVDDEFHNIGLDREDAPIQHNEGVRRFNLFEYNFNGIPKEVIKEMENLGIIPRNNVNWNPPAEKIKAYLDICKRASEDDNVFNTFKRNPDYNYVLEHTSAKLGEEYFKILYENGFDYLLDEPGLDNDKFGGTIKKRIDSFDVSPTTVQYLSIASSIYSNYVKQYGEKEMPDGLSIVEIGGGYGGQAWALSKFCCYSNYDIIDLPEVNALQLKYLRKLGIEDVFVWNSDNYKSNQRYHIVGAWHFFISNYALSEVQEPLQTEYVKNIALNCEHGYITSNGKIHAMDLIKERFPDTFKISSDIPGEVDTNFIITW